MKSPRNGRASTVGGSPDAGGFEMHCTCFRALRNICIPSAVKCETIDAGTVRKESDHDRRSRITRHG